MAHIPSTTGYAEQAAHLLERYESYDPAALFAWFAQHPQQATGSAGSEHPSVHPPSHDPYGYGHRR
jgi:hypothetical protein